MEEFNNPPAATFLVMFALCTILASAISVMLNAAAAAIDFPSENHSTPLRWRLLGLASLVLFWSLVGYLYVREPEVAIVILAGYFIVVMALGGQITGELGIISQRAQRTLPKTFIGRVFLTWLFPGAGFGYIYLICLYAALALTLSVINITNNGRLSIAGTSYLLLCYLIIYVGINRLLMLAVPRTTTARSLASISMLIVVLIMAHLVPWVVTYYLNDYNDFPYGWHQAFNIYLTVAELNDRFSPQIGVSTTILTLCALVIFGLNLVLCSRDVMLVRVTAPPRVRLEDEAAAATIQSASPVDPFAD